MQTIRVPPVSRSIPTPVAYQVERIESMAVEFTVPDDAPPMEIAAKVRDIRGAQQAELDALDDEVRSCYKMPARKYGYVAPRLEGVTTGAEAGAAYAEMVIAAAKATAPRIQAPATDPSLRQRARKAALRLKDLTGQEVNESFPSDERDAIKLVADLENEVRRLEAPKATGTAAYPPGAEVQALQRRCAREHPAARTGPGGLISIAEWDYSVQRHGEPLCREHQAAR